MSPWPSRLSAPAWSRITRESVWLETAKAIRLGTFALIIPVITSTDGRCVASTRWMPTARLFWASRMTASSTSCGEIIIRSASSSITTSRYGSVGSPRQRKGRVAPEGARGPPRGGGPAGAHRGEALVPALHLGDDVAQNGGGLLRARDDGREQVRDRLVVVQLDPLRIDQDHPHVVRGRAQQHRGEDRVDAARLA